MVQPGRDLNYGWLGFLDEQRCESPQDLGDDFLWNGADPTGLPCSPIKALHLIRQHHTGHGQSIRQRDLERVPLCLGGNRTQQSQTHASIVG